MSGTHLIARSFPQNFLKILEEKSSENHAGHCDEYTIVVCFNVWDASTPLSIHAMLSLELRRPQPQLCDQSRANPLSQTLEVLFGIMASELRRVSSEPLLTPSASSGGGGDTPLDVVNAGSQMVSPRSDTSEEPSFHYPLEGLALTWDNTEIVRQRLRDQQNLCRHIDPKKGLELDAYVERTLQNCRCNEAVLSPLLKLMHQNNGKLPSIDRVMEQVNLLFKMAKVAVTGERVYQEGWAVRRLVAHMKKMKHKSHQPKDQCFWFLLGFPLVWKMKVHLVLHLPNHPVTYLVFVFWMGLNCSS